MESASSTVLAAQIQQEDATAHELRAQAGGLMELVQTFRISEEAGSTPVPAGVLRVPGLMVELTA